MIASKYGVGRGDWYTKEDLGGHGVCFWKHIRSVWTCFDRFVSYGQTYSIGLRKRVSLWQDSWCREGPLKDLFPTLYNIAQDKQALVSDYLTWHNEEMVWSVTPIRSLQDWEIVIEDFTALMDILYHHKIKRTEEDQMRWKHTRSDIFEVRFYCHLIPRGYT